MERTLTHVALFAALMAVLGLVPPDQLWPPACRSPRNRWAIMLCGTVLGARRGALAVLLFLALVAAGLPLLSGGRGGIGVFAGPSVGFLIGFPIAAFVAGWIVERTTLPLGLAAGAGIRHRRDRRALRLRHSRHGLGHADNRPWRGQLHRHGLPARRSGQGRSGGVRHPGHRPDAPRHPCCRAPEAASTRRQHQRRANPPGRGDGGQPMPVPAGRETAAPPGWSPEAPIGCPRAKRAALQVHPPRVQPGAAQAGDGLHGIGLHDLGLRQICGRKPGLGQAPAQSPEPGQGRVAAGPHPAWPWPRCAGRGPAPDRRPRPAQRPPHPPQRPHWRR